MKSFITATIFFLLILTQTSLNAQNFKLDSLGYFINHGVNVMAFDDIYPEGHQGGLGIIMHGNRIATNGDIRLEATPGQWQPIPKQLQRKTDIENNEIRIKLSYPDSSRNKKGFNPIFYPDLVLNYEVKVKSKDNSIYVTVDLENPIPKEFEGKIGFNLELFPGILFGKPWILDNRHGIFPTQPNGPTQVIDESYKKNEFNPIDAHQIINTSYATGKKLTILPNDPYNKITIESLNSEIRLIDGRANHNNGWFVVRSEVAAGTTKGAIKWKITPNIVKDWMYKPVVQTSQVGYHPNQPKAAIIELDKRDKNYKKIQLFKINAEGTSLIKESEPTEWGSFLRYNYLKFDFSEIKDEGLYQIVYGNSNSEVIKISKDIFDRGIWQPVLEYFLPIQMCHMKVNEKYRIWHGLCHMDDAQMAPTSHNHFDGYIQGNSTMTKFKPGEIVPNQNAGGWHDAGDYDLRVESQSNEVYILCQIFEEFDVKLDETMVDQHKNIVEIHQPDGKPDLLQQIEHGTISIVNGYNVLGRLYRGIICNDLRQYVMLGDAANMTDNKIGNADDRWIFTEKNPRKELSVSAHLASASRILKNYNDTLSKQALKVAKLLFDSIEAKDRLIATKSLAAIELFLTTNDKKYKDYLSKNKVYLIENIKHTAWFIGKADKILADKKFTKSVKESLIQYKNDINKQITETPYGVPYRPHIWGAGWGIQAMGARNYYLVKNYPEIFKADLVFNALNFVLGCHPGKNTSSFASGVGAKSALVAYGVNRGDWSFIPGGVISGTSLIRPDFPELLEFPYLWQQTEYVMGGGSSNYMFLVLAVKKLCGE